VKTGRLSANRWCVALAVLVVTLSFAGCGGRRLLGFGGSADGVLLVRHTDSRPLEIWLDDESIGSASPGETTCFHALPSGGESYRLEAREPDGGDLTRATSIVLLPEQPQLWDVDRNQVVDGRAHARGCE